MDLEPKLRLALKNLQESNGDLIKAQRNIEWVANNYKSPLSRDIISDDTINKIRKQILTLIAKLENEIR